MKDELNKIKQELDTTVNTLNDVYFEAVKKIYNADFLGSRNTFLGTEGLLGKVIELSQNANKIYSEKQILNLGELSRLMSEIIQAFEQKNPQAASDLMLFDLCAVLNECCDELGRICQAEG